jgi:hypothetical protein
MAKTPKNEGGWKRTNITPVAMREYAAALHRIAEKHEKLADLMQECQILSVDARGLKQTLEAYTRIASFLGSVVTAFAEQETARGVGQMQDAVRDLERLTNRLPKDTSPPRLLPVKREVEVTATVAHGVAKNHAPKK